MAAWATPVSTMSSAISAKSRSPGSRRSARCRTVIVPSSGALLGNFDLVDLARRRRGRILVPRGALLGLDAVQAAAVGEISGVQMTTRRPPNGLAGAPYLVEHNILVDGLN